MKKKNLKNQIPNSYMISQSIPTLKFLIISILIDSVISISHKNISPSHHHTKLILQKTRHKFTDWLYCGSNCSSCLESVCHSCKDGYYLTSDNYCKICPKNCEKCLDSSTCSKCTPENYLDSQKKCSQCLTNDCLTCQDTGLCTKCSPFTYLSPIISGSSNRKCIKCGGQNCLECDPENPKNCTKCGFHSTLKLQISNSDDQQTDKKIQVCQKNPIYYHPHFWLILLSLFIILYMLCICAFILVLIVKERGEREEGEEGIYLLGGVVNQSRSGTSASEYSSPQGIQMRENRRFMDGMMDINAIDDRSSIRELYLKGSGNTGSERGYSSLRGGDVGSSNRYGTPVIRRQLNYGGMARGRGASILQRKMSSRKLRMEQDAKDLKMSFGGECDNLKLEDQLKNSYNQSSNKSGKGNDESTLQFIDPFAISFGGFPQNTKNKISK